MDRVPVDRVQAALAAPVMKVTVPRPCDETRVHKLLQGAFQRGPAAESMLFAHHAPGRRQVAVVPAVVLERQGIEQFDRAAV